MEEPFEQILNNEYYWWLYTIYNGQRESLIANEITQLKNLIPNEFVSRVDYKVDFDYNGRQISIIKTEDEWFFVSMLFDRRYTFYKCDQIDGLISFINTIL